MRIQPTRGKIFGEILGREEVTAGGIYLPDAKKTLKPEKCLVLAVGEAKENQKGDYVFAPVTVGETAYFKLAEGDKWSKDGKSYIFIEFEDVVAAVGAGGFLFACGEYVILKPVFEMETGKIIIPDGSIKRIGDFYAHVVSVGARCNLGINQGVRVRYTRDEGYPREINGEKLLIINQKWIIAEEE